MAKIIQNADLNADTLKDLEADDVEWIYNALDCCVTGEVLHKLKETSDEITRNTYNFSLELQGPVMEMQLHGVRIDTKKKHELIKDLKAKYIKVNNNLTKLVTQGIGLKTFNYRSPAQLKNLFYNVLGCTPIKGRNAQGRYTPTVNRDALEKLQREFYAEPFCLHIIALREIDKKIQFLTSEVDADGRLRTSYNIAGTNTGRLSSSKSVEDTGANNQNITQKLRRVVIADKGMKFCNVDLEQADARNVGAQLWEIFVESHGEAEAGKYLDACESGDLHTRVCSMAYTNLPWTGDLKKDRAIADDKDNYAYREFTFRDMSKRLGHGTNFYGTPPSASKILKIPAGQIERFQTQYFKGFPLIGSTNKKDFAADNWHNWVYHRLHEYSYLITPHFGRRRYFFGRPNDPRTLREAVAYVPQSMTADEIDTGIIRLWRAGLPVELLIQVHDSILFQFPEELEGEIVPKVLELLKVVIPLKKGREFFVPLEAKVGWNWGDREEHSDGSVENEHGLMKWKGAGEDTRTSPKIIDLKQMTLETLLS